MGMMQSGQCGEQCLKHIISRLCWVTAALRSVKRMKCVLALGKTGKNEENKAILVTQVQLQSLT